ncbi:bucentaur or craniofacial development-domain-containing protein [Mucor mucedo]|uniref:bucentaur or craniofacial development-domain-containing protein n=1 Tax=Mucor mucedo TaxID=29922 RepID=UPI00221EC6BC|nr:bucentaur or craniofacial development-domain-containing protein [Mucor mucedo]KAI7894629.1 bucentaur or craniofacial development-domain-containing protein [Mucor mucedo]
MSKEVSLKDFYNNPEIEEEDQDSEQDSDFVPEDNESDAEDFVESEAEDEEENTTNDKKRSLPVESATEDATVKKSRIDAIWADMNQPQSKNKVKESVPEPTEPVVEKKVNEIKKKSVMQKRPRSSLSSLVSQYNIKEPKMNTLDKSKLDWQGYVDREGIRDDLKYKNKDGYMEKVAFLQRVDDRRLSQLKSGQKKEGSKK